MRAVLVVTTVGTEEQANEIGLELITRRQAASVNTLPGVRSVYRWKGRVCRDSELMIMVKTLESEVDAVRATIHELHHYELPEIQVYPMKRAEPTFLAWITDCVDKDNGVDENEEEADLPDLDDTAF